MEAGRVPKRGRRGHASASGFTLLEVLVAVAILSISMVSLLNSQMMALRSTRQAQNITAFSFLAESKLLDIEYELKQDGWGDNDVDFDGDFSEEGWPEVTYECLVDMIEMPDYTQLANMADAADAADDGGGGPGGIDVQDAGEQAFDSLGMVWPVVKGAVERSIRKATCTVYWKEGKIAQDFAVSTFWTDPTQLMQIPEAGGEVDETDDSDEPDDGGAGGGAGGRGPPGGAGGRGGAAGGGGKGGGAGSAAPGMR